MTILPLTIIALCISTSSTSFISNSSLQIILDNHLTESGICQYEIPSSFSFVSKLFSLFNETRRFYFDSLIRVNMGHDQWKVWITSLDQCFWACIHISPRQTTWWRWQWSQTLARSSGSLRVLQHHRLQRVADHAACVQQHQQRDQHSVRAQVSEDCDRNYLLLTILQDCSGQGLPSHHRGYRQVWLWLLFYWARFVLNIHK